MIKTITKKEYKLGKYLQERYLVRLGIIIFIFTLIFSPLKAAINVSNSPSTSSVGPRVAVDRSGQVHVIWVELSGPSSGDLFYSRGNPEGTLWTTPLNLSNSNSVYCPSLMMCGIDVDASNRIYVIYVNGNQVCLRICENGVWGNPIGLDTRPGVDAPRVAVSPEGDIFAVWWASSTYRVYSRAKVGGTWEQVQEISVRQSKFPDIAVGSNKVVATWADKNVAADTYQSAFCERSRSLNASWSSPTWILPSPYSQKHQAIELDSNDIPHLIWSTEIGGERLIEYSFWSGGGFVTPVGISNQVLLHYPNLAEAKNNLYAAWQVGGYGNGLSIDYNSKINGSWQGKVSIPNSNGCTYSDVAVSPNADRVYYVWDTYAGSPGDIFIHAIVFGLPMTITTLPPELNITVDGTIYKAPQTFYWPAGSTHTLSVPSPQGGPVGTRYNFSSWSDGGAQTHTITTPYVSTTFTASFQVQYSLVTTVSPIGAGSVNPAGINWYNPGQSVTIQATASPGYNFIDWAGDVTGHQNPVSLTMNGPKTVGANFSLILSPGIKLRLLVKGSNNTEIYINSMTSAGTWENWFIVGGLTSETPSAATFNSLMYLVVKDWSDQKIWKNSWNGTGWSGWTNIDGITDAYVSLAVFNNKLYMAIAGTDGHIYYRSMDSSGNWSKWQKMNGATTHTPALAVFANRLVMVVKSFSDNIIWWNSMDTAENWSGWQVIDGLTLVAPSLVVFNNRLYAFVIGTDNFIYYRFLDLNGSISPWQRLNGSSTHSPAVAVFNNRLYLVVKSSTDARLWLNSMEEGGNWSGWQSLNGWTNKAPSLIVY